MNEQAFYDARWRRVGGSLQHDPLIIDKTERILRSIPGDVVTVLDVGCGDGAITNALVGRFKVTAVDRSSEALRFLSPEVHAIQADARSIGLPDRYADLVITSEMIEHISPRLLPAVTRELERLTASYLLISVPNREDLRQRRTWCSCCGKEFHIYLHFHNFDLRKLRKLFPDWTLIRTFTCGALETPTIRWISLLRNVIVRSFFFGIAVDTMCPRCGAKIRRQRLNNVQKMLSVALTMAERISLHVVYPRPYPDWLVVLFKRNCG